MYVFNICKNISLCLQQRMKGEKYLLWVYSFRLGTKALPQQSQIYHQFPQEITSLNN